MTNSEKYLKYEELSLTIIENNIQAFGDLFPTFGQETQYELTENRDWRAGFWTGLLWLSYARSGKEVYRQKAEAHLPTYIYRLDNNIRLNHDIGFLYTLSAKAQWLLTGDQEARNVALRAAEVLANRYRPEGKYIQAWGEIGDPDDGGRFIIDCMLNLPFLFWAAEEFDRPEFKEVAANHAATSLKNLVCKDGSAYHTFFLDQSTWQPVGPKTHQGYADDSIWARGQAWAILGFALAYEWTEEEEYLLAAAKCADKFLEESPASQIPLWDFRLDDSAPQYLDSSAAAIAALGFLRISQSNQANTAVYAQAANQMIGTLIDQAFDPSPDAQGLLKLATTHAIKEWGVNQYAIFGDYFFLEALLNLLGQDINFWGR